MRGEVFIWLVGHAFQKNSFLYLIGNNNGSTTGRADSRLHLLHDTAAWGASGSTR